MFKFRQLYILLPILLLVLNSCDLICPTEEGPNELGGSTDIDLSKVGNTYSAYVTIDNSNVDLTQDIKITKNDNGIITINIKVNTAGIPIAVLIPPQFKDQQGNVDTDIHFKVTSEGIQDYYYSDQNLSKPFTIIKYNDNVGKKWEFTSQNGKKVTREITEKTGKDEWPLGFYYIKTTKIEEVPDISGVKKVVYRANHKFGLVYVEYTLNDNTIVKINLMPWGVL